jgi:hypothetical protein
MTAPWARHICRTQEEAQVWASRKARLGWIIHVIGRADGLWMAAAQIAKVQPC